MSNRKATHFIMWEAWVSWYQASFIIQSVITRCHVNWCVFLYPGCGEIEQLFINKWRHSCVDRRRWSRHCLKEPRVCVCVRACMHADRQTDRQTGMFCAPCRDSTCTWSTDDATPQSRGSEVWLLWERTPCQGLIFRMCREFLMRAHQRRPPSFLSSRICFCCWTWSGLPARASATSSPARRTGSPGCRALVNNLMF